MHASIHPCMHNAHCLAARVDRSSRAVPFARSGDVHDRRSHRRTGRSNRERRRDRRHPYVGRYSPADQAISAPSLLARRGRGARLSGAGRFLTDVRIVTPCVNFCGQSETNSTRASGHSFRRAPLDRCTPNSPVPSTPMPPSHADSASQRTARSAHTAHR